MAQWDNRLQNSSFVNWTWQGIVSVILKALHLAQPGLTAGRQACCPGDKM